ncbi:hypothetical protein [Cloacibacillus sp. An23]|uniref:hypothetical protein n=1 Tax=Cloacibacillus sp. An23 TaxID=1965591 RepID=UPI000B38083F|nr:hypothetical protein [Cloacibacillus sp. An23]OUO93569.1 hypothetical protein B5F39_07690 [Cloacibacillus sp. An23]
MRIITTTGYYATGSSAITDFLSEFDNCKSLTNYEFRFVQDPGGISDLEFALVENHHRHNSGYALKRYKQLVDFLAGNMFIKKYEYFFHGQWKKLSYEYIEALTDFRFRGYWAYDVKERGLLFYYRKRLISKLLQKTLYRNNEERHYNEMPNEITYCSRPTEEYFLDCTRKYIDKLFSSVNEKHKPDVMVDQIVASSNVNRYIRYFNDIRVFVVERDPRDLYLLARYKWHLSILPTDLELFCKWYKYTRAHRKEENYDQRFVMFLYFEDMIYKYQETSLKIMSFLDYSSDHHIKPRTMFIPEISINGTRLWKTDLGHNHYQEIAYIEKELSEYLYRY